VIVLACADRPARVVRSAPAAYPASARLTRGDLVVIVDVLVRADGSIAGATVVRSSGKRDADASALAAARASAYAPARHDCAAAPGRARFETTFAAPVAPSNLPPGL